MIVAMLAFALLASVSLIKSLGAGWNTDNEQVATPGRQAATPTGAAEKAGR